MQQVVDDAPPAHRYFSDGFPTYAQLMYPGTHRVALGKSETHRVALGKSETHRVALGKSETHRVALGKSETYSVKGDNAELRHYLARLARRNRCFSRCIWALQRAVALFVYAWNKRQRFKRAFPKLPAHVCDFVTDLI